MGHYLWQAILKNTNRIEIDKTEYNRIFAAWKAIAAIVDIEEEWDSVVQSYIELEMALLQAAMDFMVLHNASYHEYQKLRVNFARRLSILLQSCRSYVDHIPHHLNEIKTPALGGQFKNIVRAAHSEHFNYRLMDALRNYAQHRGLPLHGASFDSRWKGSGKGRDKGQLQYSAAANIRVAEIIEDGKLPPTLRAELMEKPDRLDVATFTREYIEVLAGVHDALRNLVAEAVAEWKATVRSAIARYAEANEDVIGLCIAEFDQKECVVEQTSIFDEMLVRVEMMMGRNGNLINLRRRYVTNEILTSETPDLRARFSRS